jgi:hypothetical protein
MFHFQYSVISLWDDLENLDVAGRNLKEAGYEVVYCTSYYLLQDIARWRVHVNMIMNTPYLRVYKQHLDLKVKNLEIMTRI